MQPPRTFLYIDDDPGLARLVERNLGRHGYVVTVAAGGEEGLAQLRRQRFDAVGLDHYMPGRIGLDVLADIRRLEEPPPVIYVTGADEGRIAVSALKAGAVDYVIKDVGGSFVELLHEAVEQALEQARLRQAKERAEREMREARDRAELLLREVNHRVANSLQLVASMVGLQQKSGDVAPAARDVLVATQARIHAIAQVHRRLYTSADIRTVDLAAYIAGLAEELDGAMRANGRAHRLVVAADPAEVATDRAVSLGVIVTELVTNAYKYAYPDGAGGEVRIRLTRSGTSARLAVEDDGVGKDLAAAAQGSGLGGRIVRAMANALRARLSYETCARGTRAVLAFELPGHD